MEHLLRPRGATVSPAEKAPYIAEEYDRGPFLDYPLRSRFKDLYSLLVVNDGPAQHGTIYLSDDQKAELHVFLQTWLFFGLLHEVFGQKAPASAFVERQDDASSYITTAPLPWIAKEWIDEHYHLGDQGHGLLEHLLECLKQTNAIVDRVRRQTTVEKNIKILAICSLADALSSMVLETLHKGTGVLNANWASSFDEDELTRTIASNGWCPAGVPIQAANSEAELQLSYYASKLEQPKIRDHSQCTKTICIANQYDMDSGSLNHRCADQCCGQIHVDDSKIMEILGDGHIGLLDISYNGDLHSMTIDVVSSKDHGTYVALSHVWAEGLGNPVANALPRCQLAHVAEVVKSLNAKASAEHGKVLLWLDTLCCPVRSDEHRNICLTRMSQIYRGAMCVLILDAPLEEYNAADLDAVEICVRLRFSSWMKRLWTLQEGIQARRLWLQMRDGPVDMDTIEEEVTQLYETDFIHNGLYLPLVAYMRSLRGIINRDRMWKATNIGDIVKAFRGRSVSESSDEPLCLINSLQLDSESVVRAPPDQRMKAFWRTMESNNQDIPREIVFFTGERLAFEGLRWAPSSFLREGEFAHIRKPKTTEDIAKITKDGLSLQFPALELRVEDSVAAKDRDILNDISREVHNALFFRQNAQIWYTCLYQPSNGISAQAYLKGTHTIVTDTGLVQMMTEASNTDACQAVVGNVKSGIPTDNAIPFSCKKHILIARMNPNMATSLEAAWQISQDETLRSLISPSRKDPNEEPLLPGEKDFEYIPNDATERLLQLADKALEDPELMKSYGSKSYEASRNNVAGLAFFMYAGMVGQITRTWPGTQRWCMD